ncbi:hypothetical protein GOODEAATRI_020761, partial [Goodea atripinnis]
VCTAAPTGPAWDRVFALEASDCWCRTEKGAFLFTGGAASLSTSRSAKPRNWGMHSVSTQQRQRTIKLLRSGSLCTSAQPRLALS